MKAKSCARCGKQLPADPNARVFSHYTRFYYCADIAACAKRARRHKTVKAPA